MDDPSKEPFETFITTSVTPDGTLESYEVVVVPRLVHMRVKGVLLVRSFMIGLSKISLRFAEWILAAAERFTEALVPGQLLLKTDEGAVERSDSPTSAGGTDKGEPR